MVTGSPIATRHSLFFYLLPAPIKRDLQVALFDVEAGLVVFGGSYFSVKINKQEGKAKGFPSCFIL